MRLTDSLEGLTPDDLQGFFVGWPNPPTAETFHRLLAGSYRISLALDEHGRVVGFAQAISDGVLTAFIPLLEVLPEHQDRGLGTALMRHLLEQLGHLYAVDLSCDDDVVPFYGRLGMGRGNAMYRRNYARQSGVPEEGR
ncbi:ribosomal protein S18 acetylase RimI-like enzyme [Deinococcus sp. HSC-46F16]|uniref:GNAT family N-acetyltransferase n=1 Tax=Deinococcus sp. HSC-46F16 TaxID=2910968 RepID=UPI0020A18946|nr:GNAT family N-acetyltransferase [Deinococcus sp. HSC-46F16]MCP2013916.1 ribosomal protein S18 acetylase RimI-like enzyme [Deinococcus sp. HSC-46F16]